MAGSAEGPRSTQTSIPQPPPSRAGIDPTLAGRRLGEWQQRELRIARSFVECRGLSREQLEDVYQETTLALLARPYLSEEHLRNALRRGIKHRALNAHRDERTHARILARHAQHLQHPAPAQHELKEPENTMLLNQDRLVIKEFLTELTEQEQHVFSWLVEGLRYRAIATALDIAVNEARNASRSYERKRERFQLLYDTGRLCGYRATTIQALNDGAATSEELANRAIAHLEHCAHCRAEHHTNARTLRRTFERQAAGLLPPVLLARAGWLTRLAIRTRLTPGLTHQGGLRERAAALLTTGGLGGQAARVAAVVAVAAGAATATHALQQPHHKAPAQTQTQPPGPSPLGAASTPTPPTYSPSVQQPRNPAGRAPRMPGHIVAIPRQPVPHPAPDQREPAGFAYLGIPAPKPTRRPAQPEQQGGGPFGP